MEKSTSKPDPVFRIAKQRVNKLLTVIREDSSTDELSYDQVHKLRLCTKRLRALLQLYRTCCSRKDIKYVEKRIKALADSYSEIRDTLVQYKTLSSAVKTFNQSHDKDMRPLLSHYQSAKQANDDRGNPVDIQAGFEQVLEVWKRKFKTCTAADLNPGVEYTYRKARKLTGKAEQLNKDKAYHRCRKWVKYYLYQLTMLVKKKNSKHKSYIKKLTTLGELLGEVHDRCVLEQSLSSLAANNKEKNTGIEDSGLQMKSWLAEQKDRDKALCNELFEELFTHSHNPVKI